MAAQQKTHDGFSETLSKDKGPADTLGDDGVGQKGAVRPETQLRNIQMTLKGSAVTVSLEEDALVWQKGGAVYRLPLCEIIAVTLPRNIPKRPLGESSRDDEEEGAGEGIAATTSDLGSVNSFSIPGLAGKAAKAPQALVRRMSKRISRSLSNSKTSAPPTPDAPPPTPKSSAPIEQSETPNPVTSSPHSTRQSTKGFTPMDEVPAVYLTRMQLRRQYLLETRQSRDAMSNVFREADAAEGQSVTEDVGLGGTPSTVSFEEDAMAGLPEVGSEKAFVVHAAKRREGNHHTWKRKEYILVAPSLRACKHWVAALQAALAKQEHRPHKLMVFVNPHGGRKKAVPIYAYKIAPLFKLAGIETTVIQTTHSGHCRDVILSSDLSTYDGVVVVGGDGLFNESLNGLLAKPNTHLRVGLIPAGSTNCIVYSTTGTDCPVTSALHIIFGDRMSLDVASVRVQGKVVRYAVSMLSYGFYGDLMKDSENFRWMGPARYDYSGFKKYLEGAAYNARIAYKEAENVPSEPVLCQEGCNVCLKDSPCTRLGSDALADIADEEKSMQQVREAATLSVPGAGAEGRKRGHARTQSFQTMTKSRLEGWKEVEAEFITVNATVMSCKGPKAVAGMAPFAHLSDGCLDLIMVKKCTHPEYLMHLVRLANERKDHLKMDFVEVHKVTEFMLECRDKGSIWSIDGELLDNPGVLHVKVHSNLVHLFARRPEPKPEKRKNDIAVKSMQSPRAVTPVPPAAPPSSSEVDPTVVVSVTDADTANRLQRLEELVMALGSRVEALETENQQMRMLLQDRGIMRESDEEV